MWARVSTIFGSPDKVGTGVQQYRDQILPIARKQAGFKGAHLLVDRKSGKFVGITLWETEEALRASAAAADRLRAQGAQNAGATQPPAVEVYEVAVQA